MKFHFLQSDQVIGVELAESAGCWMRMRMLSVWRSLVGARLRWGHDTVEKTGGCRPWTLSLLSWLQTLLQSLQTLISSSFDHIYHPLTICFEGISPLLSTIFKLSTFILNCTQCRCWEDGGSCECEVKMMIMPRLDDVNHQEPHCLQSIGGHTEIFYLSVSKYSMIVDT